MEYYKGQWIVWYREGKCPSSRGCLPRLSLPTEKEFLGLPADTHRHAIYEEQVVQVSSSGETWEITHCNSLSCIEVHLIAVLNDPSSPAHLLLEVRDQLFEIDPLFIGNIFSHSSFVPRRSSMESVSGTA